MNDFFELKHKQSDPVKQTKLIAKHFQKLKRDKTTFQIFQKLAPNLSKHLEAFSNQFEKSIYRSR